jgi:hypothetical protein
MFLAVDSTQGFYLPNLALWDQGRAAAGGAVVGLAAPVAGPKARKGTPTALMLRRAGRPFRARPAGHARTPPATAR